jgi:tetrahydromethanopterin S-methyltransferase subunit G
MWWVKVVDELRAEAGAFADVFRNARVAPVKKPATPGAKTVKKVKKKAAKVKKAVTKSPAARWSSAQSKTRNSKVVKATTIKTVTPLKQRTDNPDDGYEVMHAQLGDMTPGERSAARFARTFNRIEDARWQHKGEWAVKWATPSGLRHEERFDTADEAYWFCHGQNGALPRQVLADDSTRFTVGIYYRDEDEYTDPWSEDALDNLARKVQEQGMEAEREEVYGKQLGRDLNTHYGRSGESPQGALAGLWALATRR